MNIDESMLNRLTRLEREVERLRVGDKADSTAFGRPVFLTTPLTSTSWDGDARSTTSPTKIDTSVVFGVPAGVKALMVRLVARDSVAAPSGTPYFGIGPSSTRWYQLMVRPIGGDIHSESNGVCNCDANGDIYYCIMASGSLTMDCWIEIWGYWL
jgi:hypothetical protein